MHKLSKLAASTAFAIATLPFVTVEEAAAGGGFCPIAPDAAWTSVHDTTTTALNTAFDTNKNLILQQMTFAYQRMMSAVKVDTSQQNVDGQKVSQAIQKSDEALASTMTQTDVNKQITQAHADFGPDGQSVNACETAVLIDEASSAMSVYKNSAREYMTPERVYAAPGSTKTPQEAIQDTLAKHRQKYCTASEAAAGLCSGAGSEPAADVEVATILNASASADAKDAFINNLVGLPLAKPTAQEASTARGSILMIESMRAEAVRSPAMVSIAAIRAMNEGGGGADADGSSFNASLDALMDTYGGGSGYNAWYTELATKNERGLMQELNKLRALSIKMRTFRSESNSRIAATMAAVLALDADQR
ncbi:hypothetical protein RMS29_027700 (plasmid) [Agrobacterium rosae]|uniref:Secreted protein n=1 Tax=Agrobacterium rosae TaxID=1972867 RepID=A0AAW9FP33_9HYPH|nr:MULTISPECIES: hypothetical protein [Agrobacterium]MDX8321738.1 hypothetical protein [Agrobacterium sp. rho-8.1]MDX8305204.1 hypothetical protein [Agrobacterium rosae]MDX8311485.1 hypothetical protein [Agrobacterium sp. rho-13.3]MDX8316281.1 hypothetical protein [Agrobacterium rosae]MDX8332412.1 hypothetical protein [Agrobacterium rosae]